MLKHTKETEPLAPIDVANDALLLDIDGTLLDIVAKPGDVVVPDNLRACLAAVSHRLNGALALVSGRTIASIDEAFAPLRLPAIGCHGAQFRLDPTGPVTSRAERLPGSVRDLFRDIPEQEPRVDMEDKGFTIVFHYRTAPERAWSLIALLTERMKQAPPDIEMMQGKAAIEIKPRAFTKGKAVKVLMTLPPFLERRPVYVGDDTTDEEVFPVLPPMGGVGISVGRRLSGADIVMPSPQDVRDWLARLAERA